MNSRPVILHNLSGTAVIADMRVPKGTRAISIIPVDSEVLANCALLSPDEHMALEFPLNPFTAILDELDGWVAGHDDCPGLATVLDWIDRAGISRSFDLKFWLARWRRA